MTKYRDRNLSDCRFNGRTFIYLAEQTNMSRIGQALIPELGESTP